VVVRDFPNGAAPAGQVEGAPSAARVVVAFALVYLIWGSTYLFIGLAVRSIPPLLMAGARNLIAGALLYGWVRLRGAPNPTRREWIGAGTVGVLLLFGGNGGVSFVEQWLPTGLTAVLVALVPLWIALFSWGLPGGQRPRGFAIAGLAVGTLGVVVLANPGTSGLTPVQVGGVLLLLVATACWGFGSVLSRHVPKPSNGLAGSAVQMLAGGAVLVLVGLASGEGSNFAWQHVTETSALSLLFLIFFGSLVGYVAYMWLLAHVTPAKVSTYAFVNPVIAVLLGVTVNHETFGPRAWIASALILAAVALMVAPGIARATNGWRRRQEGEARQGAEAAGPMAEPLASKVPQR
jgi:drug/metabolite transporter (DMT)-like permease